MMTSDLIINYWGIIGVILLNLAIYFILSFLLKKREISGVGKNMIIITTMIIIVVIAYLLKFIIYYQNCVEVGNAQITYARSVCTKHLLF